MVMLPPIISSTFPSTTPGPYKSLGYAYIRQPPKHPYTLQSPTYNSTGQPALKIEEIGYAVYYPCVPASREWLSGGGRGVSWLPSEDVAGVVKGYEMFLGQRAMGWIFTTLRYVAGRLKMPLYPLAPLQSSSIKYPLVIFSHGLAGTRNAYSQYCSALASEGYVVLAIEHRDGSGPAVSLPPINGDKKSRKIPYIKHEQLDFAGSSSNSLMHFRESQLEIREREVYETYSSFRNLVEGQKIDDLVISDLKAEHRDPWISSFKGMVDVEDLHLAGHSFGGGTALQILQMPPPKSTTFDRLPIRRVIALDPWLEPVPLPSSSTDAGPTMPPILVVNSSGFTEWTNHFQRLFKMIKTAQGSLLTIVGANHQAFSDFLILIPPSPSTALAHLATMHHLSHRFLSGDLKQVEELKGKEPDEGKFSRGKDGKMDAAAGEVVVHLFGDGS